MLAANGEWSRISGEASDYKFQEMMSKYHCDRYHHCKNLSKALSISARKILQNQLDIAPTGLICLHVIFTVAISSFVCYIIMSRYPARFCLSR